MWIVCAVIGGGASGRADRAALERVARGEQDALAEIYDRHSRLIYSLALRILRNDGDAQDVVQEVFAQVWRQAARYDDRRGNVAGWLVSMTRSRAIDGLRRRRSRPDQAGGDADPFVLIDPAVPADDQLFTAARAAVLRTAVDALPLLQRLAIELAFYEGLTHLEISEQLETPIGTVKTRIRQGLLKLRDRLAGAL
jgi:RNA polymerase sigma-70 factor (ECF subfamily)